MMNGKGSTFRRPRRASFLLAVDLGGPSAAHIEVSSRDDDTPEEMAERFMAEHGASTGPDVTAEDVADLLRETMLQASGVSSSSPGGASEGAQVTFSGGNDNQDDLRSAKAKTKTMVLQLVFPNDFEG